MLKNVKGFLGAFSKAFEKAPKKEEKKRVFNKKREQSK